MSENKSGGGRSLRSWLLPSPRELAGPREGILRGRQNRVRFDDRAGGGALDPSLELADKDRFETYATHFKLTPDGLERMHERMRLTIKIYAISYLFALMIAAIVLLRASSTFTKIFSLIGVLGATAVTAALLLSLMLRCYQIRYRALVSFKAFMADTANWAPPAGFRYPRSSTTPKAVPVAEA